MLGRSIIGVRAPTCNAAGAVAEVSRRPGVWDKFMNNSTHARNEKPGFVLDMRLLEAVRKGDIKTMNATLAFGANPNVVDYYGKTPLYYAIETGNLNAVKALLGAKALHTDGERDRIMALLVDSDVAEREFGEITSLLFVRERRTGQ